MRADCAQCAVNRTNLGATNRAMRLCAHTCRVGDECNRKLRNVVQIIEVRGRHEVEHERAADDADNHIAENDGEFDQRDQDAETRAADGDDQKGEPIEENVHVGCARSEPSDPSSEWFCA